MEITKKIVHRHITEEEFRRQKADSKFKQLRTAAKGVNFLCLFGGSAKVLSENALELSWTEEQIDEYLKDNDLSTELERVKKIYKNEDEAKQKYIAVATRIRDNFFKGYPGLMNRIYREQQYAENNGFCRTYFGMTRNFIMNMLKGSYDEENYSGILRNENNIAANVRCQNSEACIRGRAMYDMQCWLEERGMKSWIWNEIHDSQDAYIAKDELFPVMAHWKHICERKIPELAENWIPLLVDCEISDLSDKNHHDYYKGGRDYAEFDKEHEWETLQFEDPDPFNVELRDDFEIDYFKQRALYWKERNQEDPQKNNIEKYLKNKKEKVKNE